MLDLLVQRRLADWPGPQYCATLSRLVSKNVNGRSATLRSARPQLVGRGRPSMCCAPRGWVASQVELAPSRVCTGVMPPRARRGLASAPHSLSHSLYSALRIVGASYTRRSVVGRVSSWHRVGPRLRFRLRLPRRAKVVSSSAQGLCRRQLRDDDEPSRATFARRTKLCRAEVCVEPTFACRRQAKRVA
jgi:hypothetical protein